MDPSPPAPAWVAGLRAQQVPAIWSRSGHCWVRFKRFGMLRYPTDDVAPLGSAERRELWWRHGAGVVQHHQLADGPEQANAWLYLCRDRTYGIDSLSANNRSKVRRGCKRFDVRLLTVDDLLGHGYPAYADTLERHGIDRMSPEQFRQNWEAQRTVEARELWGAWAGSELAAWGIVHRCGRWASISSTVSERAHQRDYPNHALFATMLEHLLSAPGVESVSYGLSSLREDTSVDSLHDFKLSVGFEAVPVVRHVTVHPLLRPLVNRPVLRAVVALARRWPRSRLLLAARATLEFLLGGSDATDPGTVL